MKTLKNPYVEIYEYDEVSGEDVLRKHFEGEKFIFRAPRQLMDSSLGQAVDQFGNSVGRLISVEDLEDGAECEVKSDYANENESDIPESVVCFIEQVDCEDD